MKSKITQYFLFCFHFFKKKNEFFEYKKFLISTIPGIYIKENQNINLQIENIIEEIKNKNMEKNPIISSFPNNNGKILNQNIINSIKNFYDSIWSNRYFFFPQNCHEPAFIKNVFHDESLDILHLQINASRIIGVLNNSIQNKKEINEEDLQSWGIPHDFGNILSLNLLVKEIKAQDIMMRNLNIKEIPQKYDTITKKKCIDNDIHFFLIKNLQEIKDSVHLQFNFPSINLQDVNLFLYGLFFRFYTYNTASPLSFSINRSIYFPLYQNNNKITQNTLNNQYQPKNTLNKEPTIQNIPTPTIPAPTANIQNIPTPTIPAPTANINIPPAANIQNIPVPPGNINNKNQYLLLMKGINAIDKKNNIPFSFFKYYTGTW